MNILKYKNPQNSLIELTIGKWQMPYYVSNFVELEDTVIVCYSWDEVQANPPSKDFYFGCTVWCYNKSDQSIKWIIEEPPIARNEQGKIWNRGPMPDYPELSRDECYLDISYNEYDGTFDADTTGARRFLVDPETGKVTLIATGLR